MACGNQSHEGGWRSWALIVFLFAIGIWPVALFLLFAKLFGNDNKNRQDYTAPPPLQVDYSAEQSYTARDTARDARDAARDAVRDARHAAHDAARTVRHAARDAARDTRYAADSRARTAAQNMVRSPATKKSNARKMKIIGLVVMAMGFLAATNPADMVFSGYIAGNLWDFLEYLAIAVGGLGMFCGGLKMDANMHRYARYLAVMGETEAVSLTALSRKLGWSEKRVEKDLEKMIDRGYFGGQAYLDRSLGYFFRSSQADAELKKQREAQSAAQEPPKETEEGYSGILRNIRRANDRIADPVLTAKIDRLEDITARIFRAVEEDPKKRSRIDTFLNYYLPTTQKLLDAYAEFDAAGVEGENLRQAKQRIEKTMDSIVEGFEHQLDELYKTDAMDVDSDIRVMETMLHRDTASVEKDFGLGGSAQTAPQSTSAGDVDLGGTAAQMQEE